MIQYSEGYLKHIGVISNSSEKIKILSDDQILSELTLRSKKQMEALDKKWSFREILKYFFEQEDENLKRMELHAIGYSMLSHISHCDGMGLNNIWTKQQANQENHTDLQIKRVISDLCSIAWMNIFFVYRAFKLESNNLNEVYIKYYDFFSDIGSVQHIFRANIVSCET